MKILNLTQHNATPEQVAAGVIDLPAEKKQSLSALLTFEDLPDREDIEIRADEIVMLAMRENATHVMIGGAPFLMAELERQLKNQGITPLYAFSQRESVETVNADGSVTKTNVFKHVGFVPA